MHRGAYSVHCSQAGQGFGNAKPANKELKSSKARKGASGIKSDDSKVGFLVRFAASAVRS